MVCGPFDEGAGYEVVEGKYSTDGTALATLGDEAVGDTWTNPDTKYNIYFQLDEGGTVYSYGGMLDAEASHLDAGLYDGGAQGVFEMSLPNCTDEEKTAKVDALIVGMTKDIPECNAQGNCLLINGEEATCGTIIITGADRIEGCIESSSCGKGLPTDENNKEGLALEDGRKMSFQCGHGLRLIASAATIFASVAFSM